MKIHISYFQPSKWTIDTVAITIILQAIEIDFGYYEKRGKICFPFAFILTNKICIVTAYSNILHEFYSHLRHFLLTFFFFIAYQENR